MLTIIVNFEGAALQVNVDAYGSTARINAI